MVKVIDTKMKFSFESVSMCNYFFQIHLLHNTEIQSWEKDEIKIDYFLIKFKYFKFVYNLIIDFKVMKIYILLRLKQNDFTIFHVFTFKIDTKIKINKMKKIIPCISIVNLCRNWVRCVRNCIRPHMNKICGSFFYITIVLKQLNIKK